MNQSNEKNLWISMRWPAVVIIALLLASFIYYLTIRTAGDVLKETREAVSGIGDRLESAAGKFMTGEVTEKFISSIPQLDSEGSGLLELGTLTATETFSRSDQKSILWDMVDLGETYVQIKVPVTYRYHVRLTGEWRVVVENDVCWVRAPALRPSLPPAIHTDRMEKRSESGWFRFDELEQLERLEKSVTPTLTRYASDEQRLTLVRPLCRRTVAKFIRQWLIREKQWQEDGIRFIVVVFAGEDTDDPVHREPVLWLGERRPDLERSVED